MSGASSGPVLIRGFFFAPANRLDFIKKFLHIKADCFVIDLEDGTPEPEKESARETALEGVRFLRQNGIGSLLFIRTNPPTSEHYRADLEAAVADGVDGVVIPKLGGVEEMRTAERILVSHEERANVPRLRIIVGIETALGAQNAVELSAASDRVCAVYFGAEDFAADMGARRTEMGDEVLYARSRVVLGARLAGATAIDQAVTEIRDDERFRQDARRGRDLGYSGKICVHPRQAELANEIFSPPNDKGGYSLGVVGDYMRTAMEQARVVVAEVNDQVPWTCGDTAVEPNELDYVVHTSRPVIEIPSRPIGEVERAIAEHVAELVPDGAVLQVGIGALPDAILARLADRRDLGVHSGLIGDSIVELIKAGVITNHHKPIDRDGNGGPFRNAKPV